MGAFDWSRLGIEPSWCVSRGGAKVSAVITIMRIYLTLTGPDCIKCQEVLWAMRGRKNDQGEIISEINPAVLSITAVLPF